MFVYRQLSEGVWRTPEDFSSSVSSASDAGFSRSSDLDILNSPSLNLHDLGGTFLATATLSASLGTNTMNSGLTSASSIGKHQFYILFDVIEDVDLFKD